MSTRRAYTSMYVHNKYMYVHKKDLYVSEKDLSQQGHLCHDKYMYVHDKDHEFVVRNKDFEK